MSKKNIAYTVISVLVTIAFILLAALVFKTSYIRIFESLTDLIHSIKYYFCKLFGIDAELNRRQTTGCRGTNSRDNFALCFCVFLCYKEAVFNP